MNKINYQKELDKILQKIDKFSFVKEPEASYKVPKLLLHSCCAPCSSYVMEYLSEYFMITVFFYNPNISPLSEYIKRTEEQKRLIAAYNEQGGKYPIQMVEGTYEPDLFFRMSKGLEDCPEGGQRCFGCYGLRLRETARLATEGSFDYFTTTLTISPLKNAEKLNEIGTILEQEYGTKWLPSDFKKKNGYKRSVELSAKYGLYRQNYCGCSFSEAERKSDCQK